MNKYRIYIIASVSSLFIGVSVGLMVSASTTISAWAIPMGIAAGLGGMMIELTVPETLIATWKRANNWYRFVAVIATVTSPALLIAALPYEGISRFSVAFIVAALITYIAFYAMEKMKADEVVEKVETEQQVEFYQQEKMTRLQAELDLQKQTELARLETERLARLEKVRAIEDRKTKKALAKIENRETLPVTREAIIKLIQKEGGISKRELGRRFGRSPQTVMNYVDDLVEAGIITANGNGVWYNGN